MWWLFLASLGLSFWQPKTAEAKDYTINSVEIQAKIETDGSMTVKESRNYKFDGSFTFAYQYINKDGERKTPYVLSNFSLCEQDSCYRQIEVDDVTKTPGTFYVKDEGNRYYLKWFYRATDETKKFTLGYKVDNAVTLQKDVAEIYWQLLGNDWDKNQKNIKAVIELPPGIGNDEIKVWMHGPLTGRVSIPTATKVLYELNRLPSKEFMEMRVLLPKKVFKRGVEGNKTQSEIEDEEARFIAETEAKIKRSEGRDKTIAGILYLLIIGQIVLLIKKIKNFWKYSKDEPLPEVSISGRLWEPPSEIDPAQVEQLMSGTENLSAKSFTATILSLIKDRFYKITRSEEKEGLIFKDYKYFLEKIEKNKKAASGIQEVILELLSEMEMDERERLPLKEISKWFSKHPTQARNLLTKFWPKIVLEENVKEGFFDEKSVEMKGKYMPILSIVMFMGAIMGMGVLGVVGGRSLAAGIMTGIVSFVVMVVGGAMESAYLKRTEKGGTETAKWKAFKKHLEEYKKTVKEPIDSIVIWEKYLVYGTVLGISLKTLSQLPINFGKGEETLAMGYWGGVDGIADIGDSLNSISSAVSSSYGASGVGSSGGSSGGGGGGGGGGGAG